jgi:hypothetical protein
VSSEASGSSKLGSSNHICEWCRKSLSLTRGAVRKTTLEGFVNGGAITAAEAVVAAPSPEPASKYLAGAGVASLLTTDVAFTTKVQMQLLLEIGEIYGCPFSKDDEDDVMLIFKAALGVKGTERVTEYGRFIFTEAARKQFRNFLRLRGGRRAAQEFVSKVAGREVAKLVSEKVLMRLIPFLNALIGGGFNHWITHGVGKWAKVKAKIRASTFSSIDEIREKSRPDAKLILPIIFHVGTADDRLVDNTLTLYSQSAKRLDLDPLELEEVENLINDEGLGEILESLCKYVAEPARKPLLDIGITSAAAASLKCVEEHHRVLERLSSSFGLDYSMQHLEAKVSYLRR